MTSNDNHVDETELARLGIKRVHADIFLWGEYRYINLRDALAAARRHAGAPVGIDVQAGVGISADFAIAAARAGGEPGLWMGSTALAVARLADPAIDAELAGAVRHAGGTGDLYRVRTG